MHGPGAIGCGQVISGNTLTDAAVTDRLSVYPELVGVWSGPEIGFAVESGGASEIEFELLYDGPVEIDHDLILLERSAGMCAASDAVDVGYTRLELEPLSGGSYTLVVDGYDGAAGPYSIRMNCF